MAILLAFTREHFVPISGIAENIQVLILLQFALKKWMSLLTIRNPAWSRGGGIQIKKSQAKTKGEILQLYAPLVKTFKA